MPKPITPLRYEVDGPVAGIVVPHLYVVSGRIDELMTEINGLRDSQASDLDTVIRDIQKTAALALAKANTGGAVMWRIGLEDIIESAQERES